MSEARDLFHRSESHFAASIPGSGSTVAALHFDIWKLINVLCGKFNYNIEHGKEGKNMENLGQICFEITVPVEMRR